MAGCRMGLDHVWIKRRVYRSYVHVVHKMALSKSFPYFNMYLWICTMNGICFIQELWRRCLVGPTSCSWRYFRRVWPINYSTSHGQNHTKKDISLKVGFFTYSSGVKFLTENCCRFCSVFLLRWLYSSASYFFALAYKTGHKFLVE